jgi:hypothetical protein
MRPTRGICVALGFIVAFSLGCVMVNPSNVHMGGVMASPSPSEPGSASPSLRETAYASALKRVAHQEEKVVKQLQERDWEDLLRECGTWMEDARKLVGYADTSQDPPKFRQYGNELLVAIEGVRTAAQAHDATGCQAAIRRCDPVLNEFSRDFPLTVLPARSAPARSDSPTRVPQAVNREPRIP